MILACARKDNMIEMERTGSLAAGQIWKYKTLISAHRTAFDDLVKLLLEHDTVERPDLEKTLGSTSRVAATA